MAAVLILAPVSSGNAPVDPMARSEDARYQAAEQPDQDVEGQDQETQPVDHAHQKSRSDGLNEAGTRNVGQ